MAVIGGTPSPSADCQTLREAFSADKSVALSALPGAAARAAPAYIRLARRCRAAIAISAECCKADIWDHSISSSENHCAGNAGLLRLYLYARVRFPCAICTRDRGCSAHPVFPAPF